MRSCIYCGRELEKGEVCDCPQSVAHRAGKQQSSAERKNETKTEDKKSDKKQEKTQANYSNPYKTETSYKTGYAGTESKFERAKIKHKARKAARKAKATRTSNINPKGFFGELGRYIVRFIKSPTSNWLTDDRRPCAVMGIVTSTPSIGACPSTPAFKKLI